jgi:hypothetical protein
LFLLLKTVRCFQGLIIFFLFFCCRAFAQRFALSLTFGRHSVSFALLRRRINAVVGLLEIKLSETVVRRQLYRERHVSFIQSAQQQSCSGSSVRITTEYYGPAHHSARHYLSGTVVLFVFPKVRRGIPYKEKKIKALRVSIADSEWYVCVIV